MPATAGRVRMPANNRVHSSAALQTHGIWQSTIGYDPYASTKEEKYKSSQKTSSALELEPENAYTNYQGLLALAKITGSNTDEVRGACKKCGRVGHLTFQCRNFLSAKDEADKDPDSIHAAVLSGFEKLKGGRVKSKGKSEESSDEEEEESESSDSDYDSEIERAIAEKHGQRVSDGKLINNKKSKKRNDDSDESSDDGDREMRKEKRGRSKKKSSVKRGISDSEDEGRRKRRKYERRRRDEEEELRRKSKKEKRRRRSHRDRDEYYSSDDSAGQRHKRGSRRDHSRSDSDVSGSDDLRVGRDKMRSEKKKRHHRHHHHHHHHHRHRLD